ncbi:hypothetical protein BaRGS_00038265 [Batillaria attramentaria]|uniref:Endonuclease/exonuclease/phosphatase domain-containing protein n=1 Tax=Batillaria attramentaria TaxID=370345 RepID=A0ABD0J6I4_9CAEN
MACADNCLEILVWNIHSNNGPAETIKAELKVNVGVAKRRYKNLVLLCTDEVNSAKRGILKQSFLTSSTDANETKEAEIYYKSTGSFSMRYFDIGGFCRGHSVTVPKYTKGRFTASVLRKASKTILVVAWHGPTKRPPEVLERDGKIKSVSQDTLGKRFKKRTLVELLEFVENIRSTLRYGAVIVGGDFNLDSKVATKVMDNEMQDLRGNVLDHYNYDETKIDYLLFWNKGSQRLALELTSRVFKKEGTVFNHPIVRYRFFHGT